MGGVHIRITPALESFLRNRCASPTTSPKLRHDIEAALAGEEEVQEAPSSKGGDRRCVQRRILADLFSVKPRSDDLWELLRGGRLLFPSVRNKADDNKYSRRREVLLRRQEEREYRRMTANLSRNGGSSIAAGSLAQDIQAGFKFQALVGFNMVVAIGCGFFTFWWASRFFFEKESQRMVMGLMGAIFIMLVETVLFVLKSLKADNASRSQEVALETETLPLNLEMVALADHESPS